MKRKLKLRVKNVSSTEVNIPELGLVLGPGDMGDLSKFELKDLHTNKKLNVYFDKGLLVNLGNSSPAGSSAALKSARNRIAKMGLNDYIVKPKANKLDNNNRKKINELIKKTDPRNQPKQGFNSNNERYSDEYYNNMNPGTTREDYSQPKPRPKVDETFRSMQINPDGIVAEFGSYGNIPTAVLAGETTALKGQSAPQIETTSDVVEVTDKEGNSYKVSVSAIEARTKRKCVGTSASGKLCKKFAVHGFNSCLTHFSMSEKREYEKLKKNSK